MKTSRVLRKFLPLLCVCATATFLAMSALAQLGSTTRQRTLAGTSSNEEAYTVTLITGDRVTVHGPSRAVSIQPGEGRTHVRFNQRYQSSKDGKTEHLYVIPDDALPLIAGDKLDQMLFDVAELVHSRYDDAHRDDLPLLVTYPQRSVQRFSSPDFSAVGATAGAQLSSANGTALRISKKRTRELWDSLAAGSGVARNAARAAALPALTSSIEKVWLDRALQPLLDRSAPQVGAPVAWSAGYTGKGVAVAVIDSGIDKSHPDFAGRIADTRTFFGEVDEDIDGHGTHVASIIAGSGAASNGQYRGVAPDAQLIVGKVCEEDSCLTSAIIQGIEWAVIEKQAKIVNLSLGGLDTPGIDPLEAAINQFAADHGTLFVVAAGNEGTRWPIDTPASADGAFAVGAVNWDGQVVYFSARGPRLNDHAIKPEITAPGVQIVAARAVNTEIGGPVGEHYVSAEGTSMAAPHVAGAAAILSQQHPDWTAQELKSALMGAAKFDPSATIFEQGAGQLDIAAAIDSPLLVVPSIVSFGNVHWPHDDDVPIVRTVTYRNLSSSALTLDLRMRMTGPEGNTAPQGMFIVNPTVLAIPAGRTATARVTANTRIGVAEGFYTGTLAALDRTNGGRVVHSAPVAVDREVESYELTVTHLDRHGQPPRVFLTDLIPQNTMSDRVEPFPLRDGTYRLPAGRYTIQSWILSLDDFSSNMLLAPALELTGDQSLTLDARTAQLFSVTHPVAGAQQLFGDLIWDIAAVWGPYRNRILFGEQFTPLYTAHSGPPAKKDFTCFVFGQWLVTPETNGAAHPELYSATWVQRNTFPTGLTETVEPKKMAVVHALYAPVAPNISQALVGVAPIIGDSGFNNWFGINVELPHRRTEYYTVGPEVGWHRLEYLGDFFSAVGRLDEPTIRYPLPRRYQSRWNVAPYAAPIFSSERIAERSGDRLTIAVPFYGDGAGHDGTLFGTAEHLALYQSGTKLAEVNDNRGTFELPAGPATYRLEASSTQDVLALSSRIKLAWTFGSAHVNGATPAKVPLLNAQFKPPLDSQSMVPAGSVMRMPILVGQHGSSVPPKLKSLTVDVSFDEGLSWKRVPIGFEGNQWVALIVHPKQGQYVSLRTSLSDFFGNKFEETVIRAYELRTTET